MSKRLDLTDMVFGSLIVKNIKEVRHTHAFWECHCNYCGRDTVVRGSDLWIGKATRCKRCIKRVFNISEAIEIARRVNDGETKLSIEQDLKCSSTAVRSALKLVLETAS